MDRQLALIHVTLIIDNMNTLRMRYLSFILQDANNQIAPASEAFVFLRRKWNYLFVIKSTYEMAPLVDPASLLIGSADYFLDPEQLKSVAPNVRLLVDSDKSTASKPKGKCGFCCGQGNAGNMPIHYNRTNCPKKAQYGIEYQVRRRQHSPMLDLH